MRETLALLFSMIALLAFCSARIVGLSAAFAHGTRNGDAYAAVHKYVGRTEQILATRFSSQAFVPSGVAEIASADRELLLPPDRVVVIDDCTRFFRPPSASRMSTVSEHRAQ
jgi:hypothetical protein